jgi:hypothetical protein
MKTGGNITEITEDGRVYVKNGFGEAEFFTTDKVQQFLNRYKIGDEVEITYEEDPEGSNIISFMSKKGISPKKDFGRKSWNNFEKKLQAPNQQMSPEARNEMIRMSAIKSASAIYQGTGKEHEFLTLTQNLIKFIETGIITEKIK